MNKEFDEMFDKLLAEASVAEYKWRKFKLTKLTEKLLEEQGNTNEDVKQGEVNYSHNKSTHELLQMSSNSKSLIANIQKKNVADLQKIDGLWTVRRRPVETRKRDGLAHACKFCGKKMSTKSNLKRHIAMLHTELFSCDVCGKAEMDQLSFDHHRRFRHRIGSTLRGSARKKTASLDSVLSNMHNLLTKFKKFPKC